MTRDLFRKAYTQHKSNAKRRGVFFLLTFEEWKEVWLASNKWELRGRGASKYCMCRTGDVGAYAVGNVFIDRNVRNISDGNKGKPDSAETRAKKSAALAGQPKPWSRGENNPMHRPEVKAAMSAATSGAKHYAQRGVVTPDGYFVTAKEAAAALGISKSTVEWRAKHNKLGFSRPDQAIA
jgi:hypothetical protein